MVKFLLPQYEKPTLLSFFKNMSGVTRLEKQSTATYCAVITESGELTLGLGDMDIHKQITENYVSSTNELLSFKVCFVALLYI